MNLDVATKYKLYEASVQSVETDIDFISREYESLFGLPAKALREDFGGTGLLSCQWVRENPEHQAWAIDLDSCPQRYGQENHYARLSEDQKKRMHYVEGNVLDSYDFKTDITVAFNFSYFIFKRRSDLLNYFKKVRSGLNENGVFFLDIFGGTECHQELEEVTEHDNHSYCWDCHSYNPLTNEVLYYIHFEYDGHKYREVFTYDWRMWTVREICELLEEAGFSKVITYWEGEDDEGGGDGEFYRSSQEENCESWVTYISAIS